MTDVAGIFQKDTVRKRSQPLSAIFSNSAARPLAARGVDRRNVSRWRVALIQARSCFQLSDLALFLSGAGLVSELCIEHARALGPPEGDLRTYAQVFDEIGNETI